MFEICVVRLCPQVSLALYSYQFYFSSGNISEFKKIILRLGEFHIRNIFFLFFLNSTLDLYFHFFLNISASITHWLILFEPLIMFRYLFLGYLLLLCIYLLLTFNRT